MLMKLPSGKIYFPYPNLEPKEEMVIDFSSIRKATTGSTPASELYIPIAPGGVGERIMVFMYAKYAASTVLIESANVNWFNNAGSGYNPTYGQVQAYCKISDGTEHRVRLYTEGGGTADICGFSIRIKGYLNPLVTRAYYGLGDVQTLDTVVATGNMNQRPFIPNYIYFTAMGKQGGTALTSSDIPTSPANQIYLESHSTANSSLVVSYFQSKDTSLNLNTTWPNTEGTRKAIGFYIQSDMRAVGDPYALNGSSAGYANTLQHYMQISEHFLHKAKGNEEVYGFRFRPGNYTGTPDGVFEIGLYDVTNGYANAPLCVSKSTNVIIKSSINHLKLDTPYALEEGHKYAIAFRSSITATSPSQSMLVWTSYSGTGATRKSNLTGNSALGSTWSDSGTTTDGRYAVAAMIRYALPSNKKVTSVKIPALNKTYYVTVNIISTFSLGSVSDTTLQHGQSLTINVANAGTVEGLVYIDNVAQTITSWTNSQITITVNTTGLSDGNHSLRVLKPL